MATASTGLDYLAPQTVQRLIATADNGRDAALLRLIAGYGLRLTEAVRLRGSDVDPARGTVAVYGKVGRWRTVPIDEETASVIGELVDGRKDREPLFTDHQGGPISPDAVARILRRSANRAGITGCSVRALRRSLAENLLRAGATLAAVAALLGHRPSGVLRNVTIEEMAAAVKTLAS